jgi:NADH-ubiquinone oxidoreductase chain 3
LFGWGFWFVVFLVFFFVLGFWFVIKSGYAKRSGGELVLLGSSFECGFESCNEGRQRFSLRFFFVLILFIIFDVELGLLLQLPYFINSGLRVSRSVVLLFFFLLILGLAEEWRRGLLNWKN